MNRKLILLNVVLLAVAAYAGVELRRQWRASRARETATLNRASQTLKTPDYQRIEPQPPVAPSSYLDIAQKMLFDRSRNPNVPVEAPPPPPPPPPMPPLPVYHGMMNIDGPTAILSLGSTRQQAFRPGEQIGEFKFLDINDEGVGFEWNGQVVRKPVDQLTRVANGSSEGAQARTEMGAPAKGAAPAKPPLVGPGASVGNYRTCNVKDGHPEGHIIDGYRKVVFSSPFGPTCRWEVVK